MNEFRSTPSAASMLSIIIDCEEGFDWRSPYQGTPYTLDAVARLDRVSDLAQRLGATFTLVVTYPLLESDEAWAVIAPMADRGDVVLGAHLHPWVTPPFGEPATLANSFQGNLEPAHERAKVATLAARMAARTGVQPTVFKAGRSGFGPATAANLVAEGFTVDLSYMPHFTYARQGGPSFLDATPDPFFFPAGAPGAGLLEIPDTSGFMGLLRHAGRGLYPLVNTPAMIRLHLPGLLSRAGLLNRVPLTPEGVGLDEAIALTRLLHAGGQRVFQLSFHSTSLVPGETSYASAEDEATRILVWIESYVRFFRTELGGDVATPEQIRTTLLRAATPAGQRPAA